MEDSVWTGEPFSCSARPTARSSIEETWRQHFLKNLILLWGASPNLWCICWPVKDTILVFLSRWSSLGADQPSDFSASLWLQATAAAAFCCGRLMLKVEPALVIALKTRSFILTSQNWLLASFKSEQKMMEGEAESTLCRGHVPGSLSVGYVLFYFMFYE